MPGSFLKSFSVPRASDLNDLLDKDGNMFKAKGIATVLRTFKSDLVSSSVPLTSCIPLVFLPAREEAWEAKVKVQDMTDLLSVDNRNWKGEVTPCISQVFSLTTSEGLECLSESALRQ